jgi:hypothetical protein
VENIEEPRLNNAEIDQVVALTAEICALNESIRLLRGAPDMQRALIARRNELIIEMRASRPAAHEAVSPRR